MKKEITIGVLIILVSLLVSFNLISEKKEEAKLCQEELVVEPIEQPLGAVTSVSTFQKAKIIKMEVIRDKANVITKVYLVIRITDDLGQETDFDYNIDGSDLESIRDDFGNGVWDLVTEQTKIKYNNWINSVEKSKNTTSDLSSVEIITELGKDEITKLK